MASQEVAGYIRQNFAENSGLTIEQLRIDGLTMAEVIALSPRMTNSIDLMEAFARTSNAMRKDYGIRVRLPALPLDTLVSTVLEIFLAEFARLQKEAVA